MWVWPIAGCSFITPSKTFPSRLEKENIIGEDEEKNGSQNDFSIEKWPLFF